jgi:hypothetical protein
MSKTKIFVSSTCYDLAAVRESLREHILKLGHEPLLSEYPSFPVNPDETAIANCTKNVQKNTDILLLIIGGRRGAMDQDSGKSVTNLEYDTAQRHGIPCFVFINRSVNTLLPVWKKNPEADFTPVVDYPHVFKFIERIREENRWTFTFEKTAEIEDCLSIQLSGMLRELLERSREGKLDPLASFASESEKARSLAREKSEYWEFLLTAELLNTKLEEVRKRFERQKAGLVHTPSYAISGFEFTNWIQAKINDLMLLVAALQGQLPLIQASWGPTGQPGNVHQIKGSVDDFIRLCNQLVDWEDDLRAALPPEKMRPLKETMKGWTVVILEEMERLPKELLRPFEGGAKPTGEIKIMLTINAPQTEEFRAEIDALRSQNPADYIF